MPSTKFKLGSALPAPASFHPDRTVTDQHFIYRFDTEQRICYRQAKASDGPPAAYFRLILPTTAVPAKGPSTFTTLKHGIIIPTLLAMLVVGILLVLYPLLPGISYQVHKQFGGYSNDTSALAAPDPTHNRLIIPKIGINSAILEGPSLNILNKEEGVWHQTGNIINSNFVIAGHRWKYLPPNTTTFYNLGQLQVGDTVVVDWYGSRHYYSVSQTEQVSQNDTDILKPTATTELTLYTCYDKRQTERIVVIATPQP